ncbi:MAG: hypothetical protein KJO79_08420, partial [Verrucomicrobiae bacterium]|nr:hypothetical protein [Verrucomicrobiae bacterium]NNJ87190.1 hypothetical protein [Akkermansiaceae bacterium]
PEEFYDLSQDPDERNNLINTPAWQKEMAGMRNQLLELMQRTHDPLVAAFAQRDKRELTDQAIDGLRRDYNKLHRK